ncbi:MAG: hypothetical protein C0518_10740 [Opitutus sp.]|nr:hypothetical protein [Opitutus sp.]
MRRLPGSSCIERVTHPSPRSADSILRHQSIAFSVIIFFIWITEYIGVPHLLFDEAAGFNWQRLLFRTGITALVWLIVHVSTRRLVKRLHELEEFLLICSWCRKVGHKGDWLMLEDYFNSKFATETSHGICPDCAEKQLAKHREAMRCAAVTKTDAKH